MFLDNENHKNIDQYLRLLASAASLTRLYSDNLHPFLQYRLVENIFCRVFGAMNVSRHDSSLDAVKNDIGVGIKTYLNSNGRSFQKIAEFDRDRDLYAGRNQQGIVAVIKELRNNRLNTDKNIYRVANLYYHCVARHANRLLIFDTPMDTIGRVRDIRHQNNSIQFHDNYHEYSFNMSKSTLYMRFITPENPVAITVNILDDPYPFLETMDAVANVQLAPNHQFVILPLYSEQGGIHVPVHSGLNQWNAAGRTRHENEVYIPIPGWIQTKFPGFFPDRNTNFNLQLPTRITLQAKVCQENGKALMSNPNSALGDWLLRTVLQINPNKLAAYDDLRKIGIDSAVVYKHNNNSYNLDLLEIGSYENFKREFR